MKKAFLVFSVIAVLSACGLTNDGKIQIVATTGMIGDAAENIGGDRVSVKALMGPGVDPHLYRASAGDVRRLQKADLILYSGLHLEAQMGEVLHGMSGRTPVYAVSDSIEKTALISDASFGAAYDPHIWFDVGLWMHAIDTVRDALIAVDPDGESEYRKNWLIYHEKLTDLEKEIKKTLSKIEPKKRVVITAHDAFNYFGRAYGLDVRGLQGISTVTEAGTKDVQDLADFIAKNKIPAIFVESSVPLKNIEALQAAVKSRGFDVKIGGELFSDAMGEAGTPEGTYIGMVRHNVNTITTALIK